MTTPISARFGRHLWERLQARTRQPAGNGGIRGQSRSYGPDNTRKGDTWPDHTHNPERWFDTFNVSS